MTTARQRGERGTSNRDFGDARRARWAIERAISAGAAAYKRERDLPALIRLDHLPEEPLASQANIAAIVKRLARALRAERQRGASGHWTYDLNHHIALRQAYVAENERLAALHRGGNDDPQI